MIDAREYASALFSLTEELGTTERVREELSGVLSLFSDNPEYAKLLDTPAISKEERVKLIDEAFSSLDTNLVNFMKILSERREAHSISGAAKEYLALYDTSRGIERVTAVTAIAMTDTQTKAMTEKLEKITGKKIIITNILEPAMLGGVKIRYSGKQLDGSLKTRLEDFENRLKNIVI